MILLNNFDPFQDFFNSNPQLKILFKDYLKVPSSHMWGLFLYSHPDSKFFNESPEDRKDLIFKDYLKKDKTFDWDKYEELLKKIEVSVLTKAQRALMRWEQTLHERDDFIASIPYTLETFEAKDKMMAITPKLWDQYEAVLDRLNKDQGSTMGDIEESLSEKGII
jgi:hypothetical protein